MNTQITVSGKLDLYECNRLDRAEVVEREIFVFGTAVHFHIDIMNQSARLSDIVPLARTLCDKLLDATLHRPASNKSVSCYKGCAACCSYLVSLSLPEVFCLQNELSLMPPGDRISILISCLHAARKILKRDITEPEINGDSKLKQISEWYEGLRIQCPFLSNGICTIYEQRPLACREYFVTSSPDCCKSGGAHNPHVVRLPVSITEVLGEFAAKLEQSEPEAIILPLALVGTKEMTGRSRQTWPAVKMVHLFLDLLEQAVTKNSKMPAVPL